MSSPPTPNPLANTNTGQLVAYAAIGVVGYLLARQLGAGTLGALTVGAGAVVLGSGVLKQTS